jgi:dihydroxyacetone kinase
MGIHNEPGTSKLPLSSVSEIVDKMLSNIVDTTDSDRSFVPFSNNGSDEVVLMVNNLGSISSLELGGITNEASKWLAAKGYRLRRVLSGTYMTSLNMPGFSLTLLLLPKKGDKYSPERILELLDAKADAPGWAWTSTGEPGKLGEKIQEEAVPKAKEVEMPRE